MSGVFQTLGGALHIVSQSEERNINNKHIILIFKYITLGCPSINN